jgi:hypothetical protein
MITLQLGQMLGDAWPQLRGDGQAVIVGVDFPISLAVQVTRPTQPPNSRGPDYQTQWQQQ